MDAPVRRQFETAWRNLTALETERDATAARRARAQGQLAMLFHAYGYLDYSASAYRNARRLAPEETKWIYLSGRVERASGERAAARTAFETVLARQPGLLPALVQSGEVALEAGDAPTAERRFRRALEVDATCAAARLGLARLALDAGRPAEAAAELEAAAAWQPRAAPIRYLLAQAYSRQGRTEDARRESDAVPRQNLEQLAVALDDPWMLEVETLRIGARSHDLRALRAAAAGRFELAAVEYRQALSVNPDRVYARYGLATALVRLGRPSEATSELRKLLEVDPDHVASRILLATLLEREGRLAEAEAAARQALSDAPNDPAAHRVLAAILRRAGRTLEAIEHEALADPSRR